jgi:outer membrane protein assembly factor BamB
MKNSIAAGLVLVSLLSVARAGDWPMYRADAARSGYTAQQLPDKLELCWTYRPAAAPRPAWPTSRRMHFDRACQPIVAGGCVIFGTSADDKVIALDLASGLRRWTFFTEGPVRFAPAVWRDRLFVASDDGWLYALSLSDGKLLWKHRGGPNDRKCIGNGRLVSRWPVRGGPVVLKDTVYFAAGIWPSDGIYLHALDAKTGKLIWTNDRTGRMETPQPHAGASAKSGPAPQGYLLATNEHIFAPTGRAVPAAFKRSDGKLDYYHLQKNQSIGGARAILSDRFLLVAGCLFEQKGGDLAARCGRGVLGASRNGVVQSTGDMLVAYQWKDLQTLDRKAKPITYRGLAESARITLRSKSKTRKQSEQVVKKMTGLKALYDVKMRFKETSNAVPRQRSLEVMLSQSRPKVNSLGARVKPFLATTYERFNEVIVAGDEPVCGSADRVEVIDLKAGKARWSHPVQGAALGLAVAGGRLIVSTDQGVLYCFGAPASGAKKKAPAVSPPRVAGATYAAAAKEIIKTTGVTEGFCVDLGCGSGELSLELARRTKLQIYAVESDPAKVAAARKMLDAAGLYGVRVTVHQADPAKAPYPNYFANLIVSAGSLADNGDLRANQNVKRIQRPYGGAICMGKPGRMTAQIRGPLEGAGSWTHQNANAANTICSADRIVRGPLEMLWYRDEVLQLGDRHAQGPAPLVSRGYMVTEGLNGICAVDAYNGRTVWTFDLPGILKDYNGVHHDVGVGDTGGNFCLSDDSVFVAAGGRCLRIDLASGKQLSEMKTPVASNAKDKAWGYVACVGGMLFGTVANHEHSVSPRYADIKLRTESVSLFAMDAKTGKLSWRYDAKNSIRHNTIAIGQRRVYLIDRPIALADRITKPKGRHRPRLKPGEHPGGVMVCLDAASGRVLWKQSKDVFGTQLALSQTHGVVLMYYQAVKHPFFKLPSEIGGRLAAFDATSGRKLWDRRAAFVTRPIINGNTIYAEGGAWNVKTGKPVAFQLKRSYGCGQISASTHLMLFRSGTLGYLDLSRTAGTENFGGIRPGCWFNAIPAGGLVLVPDGSSNCACSYQMHAWLALQPQK